MGVADEMRQKALRIRKSLLFPPNAVPDHGIDLTRKSTAYKGDIPPLDTPPKKRLVPESGYEPIRFPIKFDDILNEVSSFYKLDRNLILSQVRTAAPVMARRVIVFLALKLLHKRSLSSIGRNLNKDHTTIVHARNKVNEDVVENENFLSEINVIEEKILASYRLRCAVSALGERGVAEQSRAGSPEPGVHGLDQAGAPALDAAEARQRVKIDQGSLFP